MGTIARWKFLRVICVVVIDVSFSSSIFCRVHFFFSFRSSLIFSLFPRESAGRGKALVVVRTRGRSKGRRVACYARACRGTGCREEDERRRIVINN